MASFTVVYDACVLYPAALRDLMMRLAVAGLCRAKWTEKILDEVGRLRRRPGVARRQDIVGVTNLKTDACDAGAFEARDSDVCDDSDVCPGFDDGFCADVDCDDADGGAQVFDNYPDTGGHRGIADLLREDLGWPALGNGAAPALLCARGRSGRGSSVRC